MKKLLLAFLSIPLTLIASSQGVDFKTGSWDEAVALAKKENKLLFVDLYFEGCMPCAQMDKTTFVDPAISKFINDGFISYKTDVMKEEDGKELCVRYAAGGFPTYLFLSPDGKALDVFSGYTAAERFQTLATAAVAHNKKKKFLAYSVNGAMENYPAFYAGPYLDRQQKWNPAAALAFLDQQRDLQSEQAFLVMSRMSLNEKYSTWFMAHAQELAEKYGRMPVRNKLIDILGKNAAAMGAKGDRTGFEALVLAAKPVFTEKEWRRFHKIFMENYFKSGQDMKGLAEFIVSSGHYDWEDKVTAVAQLSNSKLSAEKWSPFLQVLADKEIPAFEKAYTKAFVFYKLDDKSGALSAIKEAVSTPGGKPHEVENAKKFMDWLAAGSSTVFTPVPVYRNKPLLSE